jgi:hypothetical protein
MVEFVFGIIVALGFGFLTFVIYLYYVTPGPRDVK